MDNNGQYGFHGHSSVGYTRSFQTDQSSTTGSTGSGSASTWGARASVPSSGDSTPGFLGNNTGQQTANTEVATRSISTVAAPAAEGNWRPGGIYRCFVNNGELQFKVLAVDDCGVHIKLFPKGTQQESLAAGEAGRSNSCRPIHGCPEHSADSMMISHVPLLYSGINQLDTYLLGSENVFEEEMTGFNDWASAPRAGYFESMEMAMEKVMETLQSFAQFHQ